MKLFYFLSIFAFRVAAVKACEDLPIRFKFNKRYRGCEFIARTDTEKRCKYEGVKYHCPKTCGTCGSPCADSPMKVKIVKPLIMIRRSCVWVATKDTVTRCNLPSVRTNCPLTCTGCESCTDTIDKFLIKGGGDSFNRSCEWVAKKDTETRCLLKNIQGACKKTCGQCAV